ncbi:hypothetical protein CEXT_95331 [Caerostris extrusa]|uniref:Uncharacterized protein n=1 Tax=Caerostris extrusa TaxID=172846 RepID=A0AAV4XTQ4_CAEEX|nr:hypothetical protein CEXT_95331 [Caerostris extrusa]
MRSDLMTDLESIPVKSAVDPSLYRGRPEQQRKHIVMHFRVDQLNRGRQVISWVLIHQKFNGSYLNYRIWEQQISRIILYNSSPSKD